MVGRGRSDAMLEPGQRVKLSLAFTRECCRVVRSYGGVGDEFWRRHLSLINHMGVIASGDIELFVHIRWDDGRASWLQRSEIAEC